MALTGNCLKVIFGVQSKVSSSGIVAIVLAL